MDRPDERRRVLSFKRLTLTPYKVDIERAASKPALTKAIAAAGVFEKFAKSAWGRKLATRDAKAATSDFDRFVATSKKIKRSAQVRRRADCRCATDRASGGGRVVSRGAEQQGCSARGSPRRWGGGGLLCAPALSAGPVPLLPAAPPFFAALCPWTGTPVALPRPWTDVPLPAHPTPPSRLQVRKVFNQLKKKAAK